MKNMKFLRMWFYNDVAMENPLYICFVYLPFVYRRIVIVMNLCLNLRSLALNNFFPVCSEHDTKGITVTK